MTLELATLNRAYPCHPGRSARFHGIDRSTNAVVVKKCPECKRAWEITRRVVARTGDTRVDTLEWKEAIR